MAAKKFSKEKQRSDNDRGCHFPFDHYDIVRQRD
jgi:hypothetical protein